MRCFLPPIFTFSSEYAIRMARKNHVKLKMNGTHQLLAYADDVNLLGDNIYTKVKTQKRTMMPVMRLV
jgi:hypothetical protein